MLLPRPKDNDVEVWTCAFTFTFTFTFTAPFVVVGTTNDVTVPSVRRVLRKREMNDLLFIMVWVIVGRHFMFRLDVDC